jgi:tetratricopeptide (TPR) repeat protein
MAVAQVRTAPPSTAQTVVILPFENASKVPGLEWIGESFPEVLGDRLDNSFYVISRDDRTVAFDRAGVPANARLSRATLYRIAQDMDAQFVVLGSYDYDGQTFTATAQLLDMKQLQLSPEMKESGALVKLIEVQNAVAWDLLRLLRPEAAGTRESFLAATPAIRLDAFENYIRGVVATSPPLKIKHFREALRLNPNYTLALLQLGRTYFDNRDYEQAATALAKVPKDHETGREATFYLGLSAYYAGDFEHAERAFSYLASQMPLTEVYNNLGVVEGRRGKRAELEYLQKAVQADASDPDYHFNLAVALCRAGDPAAASRQLREALNLRPGDAEARSLLESIATTGAARVQGDTGAAMRLPLQRIKRNYDETSFQQLALEIENAAERRMASADAPTHAAYHVERGREFAKQGFWAQAGKEYREAIQLDPANAAGHAGLARVLEEANDPGAARSEAEAALRLQDSADALLVLARLDVKARQPEAARQNLARALALDPNNAEALALQRTLEPLSSAPEVKK